MAKIGKQDNDVYKPNLNDPRTVKRVERALTFCEHFLRTGRELPMHNRTIAEVFGNRGNSVTEWLKTMLLIQCRGYMVGRHSFSYRLNPYGYHKLRKQVRGRQTPKAILADEVVSEVNRLEFTYKGEDKPYRIWHPLQWINRERKREFWSANGLNYNYDIVAALPNILYQSAIRRGAEPKRMTGLKSLIDNSKLFRQRFADIAGVSYEHAKDCINSLFYGATISASPFSSFGKKINRRAIEDLQRDSAVRSLNWAIKFAWRKIEEDTGKMTRSERSYFYYREERRVLEAMRIHLRKARNRHFCEHDGVITEAPVNMDSLELEILLLTGFSLRFALKSFARNNTCDSSSRLVVGGVV